MCASIDRICYVITVLLKVSNVPSNPPCLLLLLLGFPETFFLNVTPSRFYMQSKTIKRSAHSTTLLSCARVPQRRWRVANASTPWVDIAPAARAGGDSGTRRALTCPKMIACVRRQGLPCGAVLLVALAWLPLLAADNSSYVCCDFSAAKICEQGGNGLFLSTNENASDYPKYIRAVKYLLLLCWCVRVRRPPTRCCPTVPPRAGGLALSRRAVVCSGDGDSRVDRTVSRAFLSTAVSATVCAARRHRTPPARLGVRRRPEPPHTAPPIREA